jgi:ABC-type polysaccharide/polyol phosphate transport system ATPase subunit
MTAIELSGVSKSFRKVTLKNNYGTLKSALLSFIAGTGGAKSPGADGSFAALKDVSFTVPRGETWGLIGRNGSGKSTLLKLIAGIYKPDGGTLKINGRVSALIELGAGFHPEFSGRENVFVNASILGLSKKRIQERFDEIVSFAELWDFIDAPVRTYSSGMFMRLGFSVAVHADPDILLVDEVLAVGDEAFGHKCQARLESFKKEGKTILMVTHSLSEIRKWCDGAVWIDEGRIRMIGKPTRVVDEYLTVVAERENETALQAGEAKEAREAGESPATQSKNRWGDRSVEINKVRLIGSDGAARKVFSHGQPMSVEIDYKAQEAVAEPVFGVAIYKKDGGMCYGTNTYIEEIRIQSVQGLGNLAFQIGRIDLVDGSYTLSVAAHAKDGRPYDYHDQMYDFDVRSKIKEEGVFRPPHQWAMNGARLQPQIESVDP